MSKEGLAEKRAPRISSRSGSNTRLCATVCGSFKRHLSEVANAVDELNRRSVTVLSPASPEVVDRVGEFPFVASDRSRSIKMVEDRHLEAITASDFVWLVCPDGVVGLSAAFEIGTAVAFGVPVISTAMPRDTTLREYVLRVGSFQAGIACARKLQRESLGRNTLLLSPETARVELDRRVREIQAILDLPPTAIRENAAREFDSQREAIRGILGRIPVRRLP